jgi:hypothetical protein
MRAWGTQCAAFPSTRGKPNLVSNCPYSVVAMASWCLKIAMLCPILAHALVKHIARHQLAPVFRQEMYNMKDLQYHSNLSVGGQLIQGILDTGSTELVVLSNKCKFFCGPENRLYDAAQSSMHKDGELKKVISYGSGQILGQESYDNVTIGPFSHTPSAFWEVTDAVMPLLLRAEFEAIIGVGPIPEGLHGMVPGSPANREGKALLLADMGLQTSQFSVCLGRSPGSPGYFIWNDDSVMKAPTLFQKLTVTGIGYWKTRMTNLMIGETVVGCESGCAGLLDSGTSLIAVPTTIRLAMFDLVAKIGADCSVSLRGLPRISFTLDGKVFSLPPDAYLGNLSGTPSSEVADFMSSNSTVAGSCALSVMSSSMTTEEGPMVILGMPFFRTYYSTFAQRTVTTPHEMFIAPASPDCMPSSGNVSQTLGMETTMRQIDMASVRISPSLKKMAGRKLDADTPFGKDVAIKLNHGGHEV